MDRGFVDRDGVDEPAIPTEALRSALEFAVGVAAMAAAGRPPQPYPGELRPLLRRRTLTASALEAARVVIEADPEFLGAVAGRASPDLVDEIGLLWLRRPAGWRSTVEVLLPGRGEGSNAERRRRRAAESAGARDRQDRDRAEQSLAAAVAEAEHLSRALAGATAEIERVAGERDTALTALAGLTADSKSLAAQLEVIQRELGDLRERLTAAEAIRDVALAGRAELELPAMAAAVPGVTRRGVPAKRRPLGLPGGVLGSSHRAVVHLLSHDNTTVLVDGYNVAKTTWPQLELAAQRDACVQVCERAARRWGTDIVVVFDGADVMGAAASRRAVVAVRFSPGGVSADDVIRHLAAELPVTRHVVVVTNDRAIVVDVRRLGCNVVASELFAAVANS